MKITTSVKSTFDIFWGGPGTYEATVNSFLLTADRWDFEGTIGFFCIQDYIA